MDSLERGQDNSANCVVKRTLIISALSVYYNIKTNRTMAEFQTFISKEICTGENNNTQTKFTANSCCQGEP